MTPKRKFPFIELFTQKSELTHMAPHCGNFWNVHEQRLVKARGNSREMALGVCTLWSRASLPWDRLVTSLLWKFLRVQWQCLWSHPTFSLAALVHSFLIQPRCIKCNVGMQQDPGEPNRMSGTNGKLTHSLYETCHRPEKPNVASMKPLHQGTL